MKKAIVVLVALVAATGIVVGTQATASAHDHLVPKTLLVMKERTLQTGLKVIEYSWTRPSGVGGCVTQSALLTTRFRDADRVAPGSKLSIRLLKPQRPRSLYVKAWKMVDEDGIPAGEALALPVTLKPVGQDGQTVAWDAVFRVDRPARDYYIIAEGHWTDTEGCGADQFAFWSFHVQTTGSQTNS